MKNKYNIGDKVFYMENDKVCNKSITGIYLDNEIIIDRIFYSFGDDKAFLYWIDEEDIFPSKEELLASL